MFDVFPLCAAGTYTIEDLLKLNFVMTCSAVMRRGHMRDVPAWLSGMRVGDWARSALAARHGTIELMDGIMAAYRVHAGGIWSSLQRIDRLRETARMLRALDKHLEFQYTSTITETIARPYLDLAIKARIDGEQMETGGYLLDCLRNGGWRLPVSRRLLAGLAAYTVFGSWYEAVRRAGRAVFR
jgi:hypothetical protein